MSGGIGDRFQQETKYYPDRPFSSVEHAVRRPSTYKEYPGCSKVSLPQPKSVSDAPLASVLAARRSVRDYLSKPISLEQLSYLLWASDGVSGEAYGYQFRTAPSAGALYPVETYLVVNRVAELQPGVYHYGVRDHSLDVLQVGDFAHDISYAALGQRMCGDAAVVFVWTAVFDRCKWKYGQRAYRYVYLDAGHIAQNLALAAVSIGLGTCQIGALYDDEVNKIIGADGVEESVLYMSTVGYPIG
ncbi:MAG: SagB/ThcOx family dehydrogenase [Armatimonadota bacterium]|nr:SagB/ThcOx family dehydrogenase [Armatimonadota bacterium]